MRYHALACDYDSTLATNGRVAAPVLDAIRRLKESGRATILVTGRSLDDLLAIFPGIGIFDRVVAENGGVLYRPATKETRLLGEAPPPSFLRRLRSFGVAPLDRGRVIVATREPHEGAVVAAIRDLGLELHVVFNRGAVMILPSGVNKATGLSAALSELRLSPRHVVGVGDAENDHSFLDLCECAVAVENALPVVKERSDWVTEGPDGAGVIELVDRLLRTDLAEVSRGSRKSSE
jgi:hydroxymethylpyrimidine pyrophosphatase-like HAD family hydrolase